MHLRGGAYKNSIFYYPNYGAYYSRILLLVTVVRLKINLFTRLA